MNDSNPNLNQASKSKDMSYILKWYYGSDPRQCWFLRGINPDRSFYGDITVFEGQGGKQFNVSGRISEADYSRFLLLVKEIQQYIGEDDSRAPWEGLLAQGPLTSPRIILKYRHDADQNTEQGRRFLKVVDLLTPYLQAE